MVELIIWKRNNSLTAMHEEISIRVHIDVSGRWFRNLKRLEIWVCSHVKCGNRLRIKLPKKSQLLLLNEPPVPAILQQLIDQCISVVVQMLHPQNHQTCSEFTCRFLARMTCGLGQLYGQVRRHDSGGGNNQNSCLWGALSPKRRAPTTTAFWFRDFLMWIYCWVLHRIVSHGRCHFWRS